MAKQKKTVTGRVLHDPVKDKFRPIFPLDLSKCRTIDELVRAMGDTAYTGRQIGDAADVLEAMARDKDCFVADDALRRAYCRKNGTGFLRFD